MNDNEKLAICRHCGNKSMHKLLHRGTIQEVVLDNEGAPIGAFDNIIFLTQCGTCDEVSLFRTWEYADNPEYLVDAAVLFPPERKFAGMVPKEIEISYSEAGKVKKISPIAFAILIRRALEILCLERKAVGKDLYEKIRSLAKMSVVPTTIADMADAIRSLGNDSAHDSEPQIDDKDVADLDDFFVTVVEYVYVAPKRLADLKSRMQARKAKGASNTGGSTT